MRKEGGEGEKEMGKGEERTKGGEKKKRGKARVWSGHPRFLPGLRPITPCQISVLYLVYNNE